MLPFEHANTAAECADCDFTRAVGGRGFCAKHDPTGRCETHGDYLDEKKCCATCTREAVHYDGCAIMTVNGRDMYGCGGSWVCTGCNRLVGWCCGCADDMPELCDLCWNDVTKKREAAQREAS